MSMAWLQFYKNKYRYPQYIEGLTPYGPPMESTPVGFNLRSGTLRVAGDMTDFMSCNYLSFERDNQTIYAWIEDVKFHTANSFEVTYSVDAWRTYKNRINLGTQYIVRSPEVTNLKDPLLGSTKPYPYIETKHVHTAYSYRRIFVVQCRNELFSNTPVQPNPYQFFVCEFDANDWQAPNAQGNKPIVELMDILANSGETSNIVTMYSIPYMDISQLPSAPLHIIEGGNTHTVEQGFRVISDSVNTADLLTLETPITIDNKADLLRTDHSVQIVIPEAGIINIPDELLVKENLKLRQDIDLFSGASNFMLVSGDKPNQAVYDQSVRGSSISSIPIVSDPYDTYMSQNQNALATALIGDVASIVGGGATAFMTGGLGAGIGAGIATSGVNNIVNRWAQDQDMRVKPQSNPPAFLGTALANHYNQQFWIIIRRNHVDNAEEVHANFGYPYNMLGSLSFPSGGGFIQTEGCNVASDGTVPKWALDEINTMFNQGVLVNLS